MPQFNPLAEVTPTATFALPAPEDTDKQLAPEDADRKVFPVPKEAIAPMDKKKPLALVGTDTMLGALLVVP